MLETKKRFKAGLKQFGTRINHLKMCQSMPENCAITIKIQAVNEKSLTKKQKPHPVQHKSRKIERSSTMKSKLGSQIVVGVLIIVVAIAACNTPVPPGSTSTPVSTAQSPTIHIGSASMSPDKTMKVCAGETVALTTNAQGTDLTYAWSVDGAGQLKLTDGKGDVGSSNRYTAPPTTGQDVVKATATDANNQSASDQVVILVVACPTASPTPTSTPAPAPIPIKTSPECIDDLTGLKTQDVSEGKEFYLDMRDTHDKGVDLSSRVVEITLQAAGQESQLFVKGPPPSWLNRYSNKKSIPSGSPMRFAPGFDNCDVCQLQTFTDIAIVGVKVFGATKDVRVISVCLVPK